MKIPGEVRSAWSHSQADRAYMHLIALGPGQDLNEALRLATAAQKFTARKAARATLRASRTVWGSWHDTWTGRRAYVERAREERTSPWKPRWNPEQN